MSCQTCHDVEDLAFYVSTGKKRRSLSDYPYQVVTFSTSDLWGNKVSSAGLVVRPPNSRGYVMFLHGTNAHEGSSPSKYTYRNRIYEVQIAIDEFLPYGYTLLIPDYLGEGLTSNIAHPYLQSDINSRTCMDMVLAMSNELRGGKFFITSYSEGASIGMWLVKHLEEEHPEIVISGSAQCSGPYDLSVTTRMSLSSGWNASMYDMGVKLFLISFLIYTFCRNNPSVNINNYFIPQYGLYVNEVFQKGWKETKIAKRLMLRKVFLGDIFTPHFYKILKDPSSDEDPIIKTLKRNDIYDWSPKNKMTLYYSPKDELVSPNNTHKAIEFMRRRGVPESIVREAIIPGDHGHIESFDPAMMVSRQYFDSL